MTETVRVRLSRTSVTGTTSPGLCARTATTSSSAPAMVAAIAEAGLDGVAGASIDDDQVSVPILTDQQLTAVVALLGSRDFGIAHIDTHLPSLDEVFLAITGQKASAPEDEQGAVADDALDADTNMEVSV